MKINPGIFRAYDIRGVAERDFDTEFARSLGGTYAAYLAERGDAKKPRVGVGRDCRLTSDGYAEALRDGMRSAGLDVVDLGTCPTPLVYFSTFDLDLDGAIQVTGSHNPSDHNGFKICVGKTSIHGEEIQRLREIMEAGNFPSGDGGEERVDIVKRYEEYVIGHIDRLARPLADRRRRRQRYRRTGGSRNLSCPRSRGRRALLRRGRPLPKPPPGPHRRGKPDRSDPARRRARRRPRHRLRRGRGPHRRRRADRTRHLGRRADDPVRTRRSRQDARGDHRLRGQVLAAALRRHRRARAATASCGAPGTRRSRPRCARPKPHWAAR